MLERERATWTFHTPAADLDASIRTNNPAVVQPAQSSKPTTFLPIQASAFAMTTPGELIHIMIDPALVHAGGWRTGPRID
jgi:hypothetical protein